MMKVPSCCCHCSGAVTPSVHGDKSASRSAACLGSLWHFLFSLRNPWPHLHILGICYSIPSFIFFSQVSLKCVPDPVRQPTGDQNSPPSFLHANVNMWHSRMKVLTEPTVQNKNRPLQEGRLLTIYSFSLFFFLLSGPTKIAICLHVLTKPLARKWFWPSDLNSELCRLHVSTWDVFGRLEYKNHLKWLEVCKQDLCMCCVMWDSASFDTAWCC